MSFKVGLIRILFFLFFLFKTNFHYLASFGKITINSDCSKMGINYDLILSFEQLLFLKWIVIVFSVFSAIGFLTKFSYLIVFLSFGLINVFALKFCYYNHQYIPFHIAFLFWFLLDDFSGIRLDALIFRKKKLFSHTDLIQRYNFFVRAFRVYFCIIFFSAGVSKILYGGLDWIITNSLLNYINLQNYANAGMVYLKHTQFLNHLIQQYPLFVKFLAFDTILIEFLAPLALCSKNLAKFIVFHLFIFLLGIYLIMYIDFTVWFCLFLFWLPLLNPEPTFKLSA